MGQASEEVKRASWIELYFDLVFVLAIAQVAHAVADDPSWPGVMTGLGLFTALWWTWIGFALFYNRFGNESSTWQRLVLIAATVPCGLAAVAVHDMAHGHRAAFTFSLVGVRVLLALAHFIIGGKLPARVAIGYVISALGLAVSVLLPSPWWWILWIVVIAGESVNVFTGSIRRQDLAREDIHRMRRQDVPDLSLLKPSDPRYALDAHHLAERFGLFVIILLGEVVVSAGQGALGADEHPPWATLAGAIALAGALWWIYFDSAARINHLLLELSGGSPELARSIFAIGHMIPAFALIVTAAGLRLLLEGHPPAAAFWLVSSGLAAYLVGTRTVGAGAGWQRILGVVLIIATVQLGWLNHVMPATTYVWVVFGWVLLCAYVASIGGREVHRRIVGSSR